MSKNRSGSGPLIIFLLASVCGCAGLESQVRKKSAHIIATQRDEALPYERSVSQQIAWGEKFTDEELSPPNLKTYSMPTMKLLLASLESVSFYARGTQPHLSRQERIVDEMVRRGSATPDTVEQLFHRYLAARQFEKARSLKSRFSNVELWDIPEIIESKDSAERAFRVYDISSDSKTATIKHMPIATGPKIVVAGFLGCSVTTEALGLVEADKNMLRAMQTYGIILTSRFEPGGIAVRNSKTIAARMYVAYTEEDWPGVNFIESPTFHFLKDGKIVHRFFGIDRKGRFSEDFQRGLDSIGLNKS